MIQVKKTAGLWAPSEAFLPATVGLVLASTALFIPTMAITTNRSLSVRLFFDHPTDSIPCERSWPISSFKKNT